MNLKISTTLLLSLFLLNACGESQSPAERYVASNKNRAASNAQGEKLPSTTQQTQTSPTPPTQVPAGPVVSTLPATTSEDTIKTSPAPSDNTDTSLPAGKVSDLKVLVFSKTGGYRHGDSIEEGIKSMKVLADKYKFTMVATEDAEALRKTNLANFNVVFFLNTTGEILNDDQKKDFQEYMENGGGYVGTHSASDTLYNWPFYENIVGAWFGGHSGIEQAKVRVENKMHPSTSFLPDTIMRADEWYNYRKNPRMDVTVLMNLDDTSYAGSAKKDDHPITWYKNVGKGRSWYTGFGHTRETFKDAQFLRSLLNAQLWAAKINATVAE